MRLADLDSAYDLVIAGGGITGAGIFFQAVQNGYNALLVESKDFAWGTSSRSSKMVHGGLRYMRQGRFNMTRKSVNQREYLLKKYPGLITPLHFLMPVFDDYGPRPMAMKIGLSLYSLMAQKRQHRFYSRSEVLKNIPYLRSPNLNSGVGFTDAQVDDARLVLRLIFDACQLGGTAVNYTSLEAVRRNKTGLLSSVTIRDTESKKVKEIQTRVLINATGANAETLTPCPQKGYRIRPLRGSHLIFPGHLMTLDRVVSFIHPEDLRPVYLFPWEDHLVLGTTDVDHAGNLEAEPCISKTEAQYLMDGLKFVLPKAPIDKNDCISSMAGIRPVFSKVSGTKKKKASTESREHVVWKNKGVITVTGGKLTTFRLLAQDALKAADPWLPSAKPQSGISDNTAAIQKNNRFDLRYGAWGRQAIEKFETSLFEPIPGTNRLWAELCYCAAHEQVCHLDDLMLRRLRIGLFLPNGGLSILDTIQKICSPFVDWDDTRWETEKANYITTWEQCYAPPF